MQTLAPPTREGHRVCNLDGPGAVVMLKFSIFALAMGVLSTSSALASGMCQQPKPPELPANGAVITYEQLNFAAKQVSAYAKANMAYKICLDQIITQPSNYSRTQWRAAMTAYNQTVPAENSVWSIYEKISDDWISANQAKPN